MLTNNLFATLITFSVALAWLRINDYTAHRGWISSDLSRKIIHIGTGPLFVLCWLIFQETAYARVLAALVPFAITAQFVLVGTGVVRDEAAVRAMSRSGDRREILRGPLYYGIVFVLLTLVFWRDTPIGIVALMLMCGGDGLAEIIGRRYPLRQLPWSAKKSFGGSLGMLVGGWAFAFMVLAIYIWAGVFLHPLSEYIPKLLIIAVAGMLVESLPVRDIDNLTISLTAVALGYALF